VGYDAATNPLQDFYFVNNTVINRYAGNIKYFNTVPAAGINTFKIYNNIFASVPGANNTFFSGNTPGALDSSNNIDAGNYLTIGFVNPSTGDYSLTAASTLAINQGTNAGNTNTAFSLTPVNMYQSSTTPLLPRAVIGGLIDIGAYEYPGSVGIAESHAQATASIYPNPSRGQLKLELNGMKPGRNCTLEVYTVLSEKVFQSVIISHESTLNLTDLSDGIYYLKIDDGQSSIIRKIVIDQIY
jgi:Secretion system C-terminal sorting domain